jgi:hypothetical protein
MKTLKDFIESFKYNKYSDDLLNYSYEDFCEDKIVETLVGEDNKIYSYLDYQFIKYLQGDEYDMYSKYQQLLYESLLKSYDTKKFVNILNKKFKKYIFKIELINTSDIVNSIRIKFKKEFDITNKEYQSLLNLYNYYESKNIDNKIITLSPRISEDMSDKVYNESNGIVYHVCPNYVVDKILENGLRPKGGKNSKIYKNRVWHPKSIYVIFDKVDNDIKNYFKKEIENDKITNEYDNNVLSNNDVTILKIDLNKYDRKLKFYKDTLGGKSFIYTKEYIPPQCISIYKENKIKKFFKDLFKL